MPLARGERMGSSQGWLFQVADYGAAYPGAFIASLRALETPCRVLGLSLGFVFSSRVQDPPWLSGLRRDGFPVHVLGAGDPLAARTRALRTLAARHGPTILHTHFGTFDVPAALAALGSRGRTRVVWHAHNALPRGRSFRSAVKDVAKLAVLGRWAWLATASPALIDEAVAHGFPRSRARHVSNGVDLGHATRTRLGREAFRHALGISPDAVVVLAFGWEPHRKGIDLALAALREGAPGPTEPVLLAVGAERLRAYLVEAGGGAIPRRIRFFGQREDVGDLYAAADVFLSASREEGFSYALGEALANGLPVVASDIPGTRWARAAPGVELFRSGDAASLGGALRRSFARPAAEREAAAAGARRFAREQLALAAWARRVADVYRTALEEAPAWPRSADPLEASGART